MKKAFLFLEKNRYYFMGFLVLLSVIIVFMWWNDSKKQLKENQKLQDELTKSKAITAHLKSQFETSEHIRKKYKQVYDSIQELIKANDKEIIKLKNDKNEKISKVPNWRPNDRQLWIDNNYPRTGN
jgi:uncharacterized membrane protein